MSVDPTNYRQERIERLLQELRFEITRGMMEREIEEEMHFVFVVPTSKHLPKGVVSCEFHTFPTHMGNVVPGAGQPRLRVVKKESQ